MAPASASPFTVLYLRPEIATGFYNFPAAVAAEPPTEDPPAGDPDAPGSDGARSPPSSPFPGVPVDEAAFFFPDGQIVAAVRRRLQRSGFEIVQERLVQFSRPQLRRLYFAGLNAEDDEATRAAFLDRFTRGPTLALLLSLHETNADAAVTTLHALVGPENPTLARQQALGAGLPVDAWPLRALCGLNTDFPGVYASATLDCAMRERHELFRAPESLESAVVALLPPLLAAILDAKSQLLTAFNRHGLVVMTARELPSLSAEQIAAIATAELHPTVTDVAGKETFCSLLEGFVTGSNGATLVLRVVGFHVDATLRQLIGPSSSALAQRFFPESLRAQLPAPLIAPEDAVRSREGGATCLEIGIFISQQPAVVQALAPEDSTITQTFAIIKPNAARNAATVDAIQHAIRAFGFSIDRQRRLRLSPAQAAAFYAEHTGKPFFTRLTAFMTSGEIVAMQLSRRLAIPMWRALMGPTNCLVARETHPWTLRARFGLDGTQNATHGSDAPTSARRELRFFFGESPWNAPLEHEAAAAAKVAQASATKAETLEAVLVRGLEVLLARQQQPKNQEDPWVGGPLEACRFLGEWLLRQSELPQAADDNDDSKATKVSGRGTNLKAVVVTKPSPENSEQAHEEDEARRIVAIVLDASVASATRETVKQLVRDRVEPLGYAFVDVQAVATASSLAAHVASVGRRRVALFDWQDQVPSQSTVRPSVVAVMTTTTAAVAATAASEEPLVARATFNIPATLQDASPLHALFRSVLDPLVVAVVGSDGTLEWQRVATHAGAAWLAFDVLVAREIARERDPLGLFTQWQRTHAALAPSLVLEALRRAIADPASVGLAPAAHKFVLVGFPWSSLDARALDRAVGRVACVVRCGKSDTDDEPTWSRVFEARGIVARCEDLEAGRAVLARVLAPHVTLVLGAANAKDAVNAVQLGDVWIDVHGTSTLNASQLRRVRLLRRVVLCGFPSTPEQALAVLRDVAVPRAVLVVGPVTSELESVLAFLQREAPHAIQSVISATTPRPQLCRVLLATRVAVAVGDSDAVDAVALRPQLAAFGAALVDLRSRDAVNADATLDALAGVVAPRCLLLLRGATSVDVVRALHARLGDALAELVVLKQRKAQPPPPRRRVGDDGDLDDAYDSDEERERERARQREASALSPALAALVDALQKTPLRVRVASFLRVPEAHAALVAALRPAVVGVRGHALTFYREAARAVCRTRHVPFVDLRESSDVLARLCGVISASAAPLVVVDGFPWESPDGLFEAPYAAQQLLALERVVAAPLFVRFRASLDVLLEKLAAGRNALEDAQDAMTSPAARDVDACFATGSATRLLRDVSCERELQDAQDAFTDVLTSCGLVA